MNPNLDIHQINIADSLYPKLLKKIKDPPKTLYIKGEYDFLSYNPSVAIIGTRTPTYDSLKKAFRIAQIVGQNGYTIISGLALGCDTAAHQGALSVNAKTVAVLPSGFNQIYPFENKSLADKIFQKGGCLISEYKPNIIANKARFIERDRIQSGLSNGIILIEASNEGGTRYTINFALNDKKKIAVLSNNNHGFELNNKLISSKKCYTFSSVKEINEFLFSFKKT